MVNKSPRLSLSSQGRARLSHFSGAIAILLLVQFAQAETVLTPRDRAAFEAEMRALNEKYGPKKFDGNTSTDIPAQSAAEPRSATSANEADQPIDTMSELAAQDALATAQAQQGAKADNVDKLRVELLPEGSQTFRFDDKVYGVAELIPVLKALQQKFSIDYIVLAQKNAMPVELTHIVELAKLSRELRAPVVYQDGKELRAVDAR